MKILFSILMLLTIKSGQCLAQILLKTAGSENGILNSSTSSANLGYDFSDDEALFNYLYGVTKTKRYLVMNDHSTIKLDGQNSASINKANIVDTVDYLPFHSFNLKLSLPVEKNAKALLSENSFSPGIGATFDYIWNKNEDRARYLTNFVRLTYKTSSSTFGSLDSQDSIVTVDKTTESMGISIGVNFITSPKENKQNLIAAFFIPILYNSNSALDLKKKNYITDYKMGTNGIIIKESEAYNGTPLNFWSINPKIDFAWTPWFTTDGKGAEEGPRIGFMSSLSATLFAKATTGMNTDPRFNFSVGPSIHPKWSTSNVIATIQAEFIDFTDASGTKTSKDIFGVNFYVGIPLNFK